MKTEDFNKINEELQKEIQKNNEQIVINGERKRMSNVNQLEYKLTQTLAFSMLPYLGLVVLSEKLIENGIMATLTEFLPALSFPLVVVGCSLGIGTIARKIIEWKFQTKKRFKSFSTAHTQSEKIQEEVKYTVELAKAQNRNRGIQEAINSLRSTQSILKSLSSKYDINDKAIPQTAKEANDNASELSILLKDKMDELDILTTQKILHEKFWRVRTKYQKAIDASVTGIMGGFFATSYFDMSLIIVKDYLSHSVFSVVSSPLIFTFIPLIVGFICTCGYMVKRNKNYIIAFNNLNSQLGENALPNKIKDVDEERQNIDTKIESKIRELSIATIQLQEQKRIIESFSTGDNEKEHTIEKSKGIFEEAKRKPQVEKKDHSLVLRKKPKYPRR